VSFATCDLSALSTPLTPSNRHLHDRGHWSFRRRVPEEWGVDVWARQYPSALERSAVKLTSNGAGAQVADGKGDLCSSAGTHALILNATAFADGDGQVR